MGIVKRYKYELALLLTLIIAAAFRFYKLDVQSLWFDELYTVNQASPHVSWEQLFYYSQTDQHPPLYFILQRLVFNILGHTEWAARSLPAFCGVLCVWAMYRLGKEFRDKKLGIVLALMTAASQYNVRYSQEARAYTLTWLLAILSYLFFIKMVKSLKRKDAILYILFSSALIYTNYFGFLVLLSQAVIGSIVWILEREEKKKVFTMLFLAAIGIIFSYLPWFKYMLAQTGLKPFWMQGERPWFFFYYYYTYFGGERLLIPFLVVGPALYLYSLFRNIKDRLQPRQNEMHLSAIFIMVSIAVPFLVLYLRSELYSPILQLRYTIITIPSMYLLVGYGITMVRPPKLVMPLGVIFMTCAAYNLVVRHKFYSYPLEKQYRQASHYMASEGSTYPVLNKVNGWQMKYYMKKYGQSGPLIMTNKNLAVDSILMQAPGHGIDTFWIVTGFLDVPLSINRQTRLEKSFEKIKQHEFQSITVELYGKRPK